MVDVDKLETFVHAAETLSFSNAAKQLKSHPTDRQLPHKISRRGNGVRTL